MNSAVCAFLPFGNPSMSNIRRVENEHYSQGTYSLEEIDR